jgi:PTH1 family peptidyl-tRNA hydrolase
MLLDSYLQERQFNVFWKKQFGGLIFDTMISGEKVLFVKPETYMNLSGVCISNIVNYYNIDISDILIVSDDLDLFVGNYKLKPSGSSGGHNGLKNIESMIGTSNYKRLRIGISKDGVIPVKDYVVSKFSASDFSKIDVLFKELFLLLDDYFIMDFDSLMCKYNKKNR